MRQGQSETGRVAAHCMAGSGFFLRDSCARIGVILEHTISAV